MKRRNFFANLLGAIAAPKVLLELKPAVAKPPVDSLGLIPAPNLDLEGNLYIGLYTKDDNFEDKEVDEKLWKSYQRVAVKRDTEHWEIKGDEERVGVVRNKEQIVFPECTGGRVELHGGYIFAKADGGPYLYDFSIDPFITVEPGVAPVIPARGLTIRSE